MKKRQKLPQIFECINCNFKCSKNSEFERHKMTAKHQRLTNPNKKTPNLYSCVCGKSYKHQSTLCAHKKICPKWRFFLTNPNEKAPHENSSGVNDFKNFNDECSLKNQYNDDISEISEESHTNTDLIVSILKQNNEFKTFMIDQCNTMQQQTKDLQKQLIEVVKDGKIILAGLRPDPQRYFDYHHAASDTFDKINKRELELGAAAIASLVYLIDNYKL